MHVFFEMPGKPGLYATGEIFSGNAEVMITNFDMARQAAYAAVLRKNERENRTLPDISGAVLEVTGAPGMTQRNAIALEMLKIILPYNTVNGNMPQLIERAVSYADMMVRMGAESDKFLNTAIDLMKAFDPVLDGKPSPISAVWAALVHLSYLLTSIDINQTITVEQVKTDDPTSLYDCIGEARSFIQTLKDILHKNGFIAFT